MGINHYAFLDDNNVVEQVIQGVDADLIDGVLPEIWYANFRNQVCVKSTEKRKNEAAIGFTYDEARDAFIPPQPYPSWTLNESTCLWEAPVQYPDDNQMYLWNEESQQWDAVDN